jgi:hypothetical protein
MTTRGDIIGDAVSEALSSVDVSTGTPEERKQRIWRAICNAFEPYFEPAWIDIFVNPTLTPVYISGNTPYPMETVAWQLAEETQVPEAIWLKTGPGVFDWSRLWPGPTGPPGATGPMGGAITIAYTFSTLTTDGDPGDGYLRLDNSAQSASTVIRADLKDSGGTDWSGVLSTLADSTNLLKGHIRLVKASDTTKWLLFSVSAVASPEGYRNITVANVGSSGANPFSNGDAIVLLFTRAGDRGTTGTQGPTAVYVSFGLAKAISGGNPVGFCLGNDNTQANGLPSYATNGMQNEKTIFPWIAPVAGTITAITFTLEGAAISQGGPVASPYMKIQFCKSGYNTVTLLGTINVALNAAKTGVNNTTTGKNYWQTASVTGLQLAVSQGDAIGVLFVPQGGDNSKINAILNLFATLVFTPA